MMAAVFWEKHRAPNFRAVLYVIVLNTRAYIFGGMVAFLASSKILI